MTEYNGSNPTFNFNGVDEAVYEQQPYQFNGGYTQQWWPSGTTSLIPSAPSPTNTVRTQWTAPPTQAQQKNHLRPRNVHQRSSNIDPRLQGSHQSLPRLDTRPSLTNQPNSEPILNPIALFYRQDSEPWNALGGMRNPQESVAQNILLQAQVNYGQHRKGPSSDVGSNVPASDSGYYTHQTLSVLSDDPVRIHQELPAGLLDQAKNLNVDRSPTGSQPMTRRPSDQRSVLSRHSSRSGSHKQPFPCREVGCLVVSRCLSEHKKHMLKHQKNFICSVSNCRRAGKGFSTINDLDRHKKSVHKIGVDKSKSYQCAALSCAKKDKIWPRLDNFKQHIDRMHKEDDSFELIKNSEFQPPDSAETQQTLALDPALLAGMGDPNDALTSPNSQSFPYQSSVSFHASSMSSASGLSPGTVAPATSFSQFNAPLPMIGNANPSKNSSIPSSSRNVSNIPTGHRKSTTVPSAGVSSALSSMPGSTQDRGQLQLSTAPQTKFEQQRQALAKLSKANINIEEIVQRVLGAQRQQDGSNGSLVLSETETLHASQAIADLLKEKTKTMRLQQRGSTQGSASGTQYCEVENCLFSGRICDLNKHRKRHQRPYGCTYPKCHKRFGAKSDWKRHENSQHFQLEAFRCDHPNALGQKCGQHCYRSVQFHKHLAEKHKITSETQVEASLKRCRIGKNCQGQFWCGFCREIKTLRTKRNAAWDERFDHIALHFERDKKPIDEWLCVEENRTKAQLRMDMDRAVFEDDSPKEVDPEAMESERSFTYEAATTSSARFDAQGAMHRGFAPGEADSPTRSRKRPRPAAEPRRQCCECFTESTIVQASCYGCSHDFCDGCERVYVNVDDRADDNMFN